MRPRRRQRRLRTLRRDARPRGAGLAGWRRRIGGDSPAGVRQRKMFAGAAASSSAQRIAMGARARGRRNGKWPPRGAPPAAFIATQRGRLASKWRSWAVTPPTSPDLLRRNCAVTPPTSTTVTENGHTTSPTTAPDPEGHRCDQTNRPPGQASDPSSRAQDPRRRRLRRAASRSRTKSPTRTKVHQQGGGAIRSCEKAKNCTSVKSGRLEAAGRNEPDEGAAG